MKYSKQKHQFYHFSNRQLLLNKHLLKSKEMDEIEKNVLSSYDSLDDVEGFDSFDPLKKSLNTHKYEILELLAKIRKQVISNKRINPWLDFKIHNSGDKYYNSFKRHLSLELDESIPVNKTINVGIVNGTFDPFHIGHLLMGLNHLAHGTSDFIVYLPNDDVGVNEYSAKPNKSKFNWRFETVMYGGVEDMFPLLRVSTFGKNGKNIVFNNQELIDKLDKIQFNIIIGSDILKKPNMAKKLESDYKSVQQMGVSTSKINFTFHIIQRKKSELSEKEITEIRKSITFPIIESPVSDASSTASSTQLKEGVVDHFSNIYPSSLNLLGPYIQSIVSNQIKTELPRN